MFLSPPLPKDAPRISSDILHSYHGDDPRLSHAHGAADPSVQRAAAPSMLGNVQRTALSALLPSSSCEFEQGRAGSVSAVCVARTSHAAPA